jgi:hypothetical protein
VWYLLTTIIGLQVLADVGFSPTFTRLFSYALGGASSFADVPPPAAAVGATRGPNWDLVERVWRTMGVVYRGLAFAVLAPLMALGTLALMRPMRALPNPVDGWLAWGAVLLVSVGVVWANGYSAYLQGMNQVALLRRWEALTSVGAIVTSFAVLMCGGRLLALVLANQGWVVVGVLRNRALCRTIADGRAGRFSNIGADASVLAAAWPPAWRSAVGITFSRGVLYASGLIYAQIAQAVELSAYLLAFRLVQLVSELSQAPFYSKIPLLSRLRSEGKLNEQRAVARRGMRLAHWTFVAGFVGVGVLASPLLRLVESAIPFPPIMLWCLMGVSFFIERYGAMHLQLYSTTNHIIWHIVNGVTGVLYLIVSFALLGTFGVYAFPIGVIVAYLGFYSWYSPLKVYRMYAETFLRFEATVFIPAAVAVLIYVALCALKGAW